MSERKQWSSSVAPRILDIGTIWARVVSCTLRTIYTRETTLVGCIRAVESESVKMYRLRHRNRSRYKTLNRYYFHTFATVWSRRRPQAWEESMTPWATRCGNNALQLRPRILRIWKKNGRASCKCNMCFTAWYFSEKYHSQIHRPVDSRGGDEMSYDTIYHFSRFKLLTHTELLWRSRSRRFCVPTPHPWAPLNKGLGALRNSSGICGK
jgi:hypothetical protein